MIGSGLRTGYRRASVGPLDGIRFALGIILVVGLLMVFVVGRLTENVWLQLGLLMAYGCGGALWIIHRARRVLRTIRRQ